MAKYLTGRKNGDSLNSPHLIYGPSSIGPLWLLVQLCKYWFFITEAVIFHFWGVIKHIFTPPIGPILEDQ